MLRAATLALFIFTASPAPGPATFRNVADRARPALGVLVCRNARASAVIVGGSGQVLSTAYVCRSAEAHLKMADGRELPLARVRADPKLGLQLLQLPPGTYVAAPAARHAAFAGDWIVAVAAGDRGIHAAAGMLDGVDPTHRDRVLIDAPTHPGAGIFSLSGKLVGIAVASAPRHQMRVVPIDSIRDWLSGALTASSGNGGAR